MSRLSKVESCRSAHPGRLGPHPVGAHGRAPARWAHYIAPVPYHDLDSRYSPPQNQLARVGLEPDAEESAAIIWRGRRLRHRAALDAAVALCEPGARGAAETRAP